MGNHRSSTAAGTLRLPLWLLGALLATGCPTVDLGDSPSDVGVCNPPGGIDYFQNMIWPKYVIRSNDDTTCTRSGGCHAEDGGNALTFKTMPVDYTANFARVQVYLNCGTPEASPLLTKPLAGEDIHGGGDIFPDDNDPAVAVFLGWFQ